MVFLSCLKPYSRLRRSGMTNYLICLIEISGATMSDQQRPRKTIYLKDYRPPDYLVETVMLEFELDEMQTRVKSVMTVACNHDRCEGIHPFILDGGGQKLLAISLDGRPLAPGEYKQDAGSLTLLPVPDRFTLELVAEINPSANTELSG